MANPYCIRLLILLTVSLPGLFSSLASADNRSEIMLRESQLRGYEASLGPNHPSVATSIDSIALLYQADGKYAHAEALFQRALTIKEKVLGPDHPDVAESLNRLAELYFAQGLYDQAEPLLKRSLAIREKALGPDHPSVATSINNLGELYRTQGLYDQAEPLLKRSLAIREKALGPDHLHVSASLARFASLYYEQGLYVNQDLAGLVTGVEVIGRSETELRSIFEAIARKHNIDPTLGVFDSIEHPAPEGSHAFALDSPPIHRAIAKIAYGFACIRLPAAMILQEPFTAIRQYILRGTDGPFVSSNYAHGDFMVDNLRPLHKIHLSFNRNDSLAIGYVALFGIFRYTVLLSDSIDSDIEWAGIDYSYDPITQSEVPSNPQFQPPPLSKVEVVQPRQSREQVRNALQRGHQVLVDYSPALAEITIE